MQRRLNATQDQSAVSISGSDTSDGEKKTRKRKRKGEIISPRYTAPVLITLVVVLSVTLLYNLVLSPTSPANLQTENEALLSKLEAYKEKVYTYENIKTNTNAELKTLRYQNDMLVQESLERTNEDENNINVEQAQKLLKDSQYLMSYSFWLRQGIQNLSRRAVKERFGTGPHRVRITLQFPPSDAPEHASFVVELAPLSLVPHTTHVFLTWVTEGLLTGTAFRTNPGHVIQAGPQSEEGRGRFETSGLGSVLFQEYSKEYPHVTYTVGIAGRPGGPDWYVSIIDNTLNHGPGGQPGYKLRNEADPCFGKVIEGFDTVDRIASMSVRENDKFMTLKETVEITSAVLLSEE